MGTRTCLCFAQLLSVINSAHNKSGVRFETRVKVAKMVFAITKTILLDYVFWISSVVGRSSFDVDTFPSLHFFLDIELKASYKGDTSAYRCIGARD